MTAPLVLAVLAAALVAAASSGPARAPARTAYAPARLRADKPFGTRGRRVLGAIAWSGGAVSTSNGETLTVYVSPAYADDPAAVQRWADTFGGFPHGAELSQLTAYVATPAEVAQLCSSERALGCYGDGQLVTIGETTAGVDALEVARHEYGHHIAHARLNPPWDSEEWGTKRWASYVGVCTRVAAGTAFPGDEDLHYSLNPGEAFAETYRALAESKAGVTAFSWTLADTSFYPDTNALTAAEQDVTQPYAPGTGRTLRATLAARGRPAWSLQLSTPLDGLLTATLNLPATRVYDLVLTAADGGTVLASSHWSGTRTRTLAFTICGERQVTLRVTRSSFASPGPFTLTLTRP